MNIIEARMGTSWSDPADFPTVAIADTAVVVDATRDMMITYNFAPLVGGYAAQGSVVLFIRAGTIPQDSIVQISEVRDELDPAMPMLPSGWTSVSAVSPQRRRARLPFISPTAVPAP